MSFPDYVLDLVDSKWTLVIFNVVSTVPLKALTVWWDEETRRLAVMTGPEFRASWWLLMVPIPFSVLSPTCLKAR